MRLALRKLGESRLVRVLRLIFLADWTNYLKQHFSIERTTKDRSALRKLHTDLRVGVGMPRKNKRINNYRIPS